MAVTAHGVKTVYVAGQIAGGDSLAAQTAAVWERVAQRLDAAGASLEDLVKATTYIVDFNPETDLPAYRAGRDQALALDDMPASTLLGIPALAGEQFQIEIDGIAVVGVDGNAVEREFIDPAAGFTQAVTARGTVRRWSRFPDRWDNRAIRWRVRPTRCTPTCGGVWR